MIKLGVFSDVHANLPALQAVLAFFEDEACNRIFHLGDAVAIGPYPLESLELLLATPNLDLIMGNHDMWYAHGLPRPHPEWMSDGELQHEQWTHAQLSETHKKVVRTWKLAIEEEIDGVKIAFTHFGVEDNRRDFKSIIRNPLAGNLDRIFAEHTHTDLVLYGHTHTISHMQGMARYVNPGSVGCTTTAIANCLTITIEGGVFEIRQYYISYDDTAVLRAFDEREVPARDFLRQTFYGGRFPE